MNASVTKKIILIVMTTGLIVTMLIALILVHSKIEKEKIQLAKREEQSAHVIQQRFQEIMTEAQYALSAIEDFPPINALLKDEKVKQSPTLQKVWLERLYKIFHSFLRSYPHFSQLYLVSDKEQFFDILVGVSRGSSNELYRTDAFRYKKLRLQDADLDKIRRERNKNKKFYTTTIGLNSEYGKTKIPYQLTKQIIRPIRINEQIEMFLIIDIDVKSIFDEIKNKYIHGQNFEIIRGDGSILYRTQNNGEIAYKNNEWKKYHTKLNIQKFQLPTTNNTKHYISYDENNRNSSISMIELIKEVAPWGTLVVLLLALTYIILNHYVVSKVTKLASYLEGVRQVENFSLTNGYHEIKDEVVFLEKSLKALISELLQSKRQASEHNDFLNAATIFFETDVKGNIKYANKYFLDFYGYQISEVLQNNISIIGSGAHDEKFWHSFWRTISSGHIWKGKIKNQSKSGKSCYLDSTVMPKKDPSGKIVGYICVSFDITKEVEARKRISKERKRAENAEQAKSIFLANMSHEIRTPMNGIIGFAQILKDEVKDKDTKEYISIIEKCGNSLLEIINNILDISKIEAGKLKIQKTDVNLKSSIKSRTAIFKNEAEKKGVELELMMDPQIPNTITTDETKILQIISNLLNNAIKFTDDGKINIDIYLNEIKGAKLDIGIRVSDTGIGMRPNDLLNLFSEFYQADVSSSKTYVGTGLGLSITKKLVELLGGKIHVESVYGKGSIFTLNFKCSVANSPEISIDTVITSNLTTTPLNILVVDDNEINKIIISKYLTKDGHCVDSVIEGEEALKKLEQKTYNVIVMDCFMPGMDGFSTTKRIVEQYKEQRPYIIAHSASVSQSHIQKCYQAGMDFFLPKPFKENELNKILTQIEKKLN